MKILRAGLDPRAQERLISTIQNNQQSFNRLQSKSLLFLFWSHPSPTYKDKRCNPLRLLIENPWSMTWEPCIFRRYGLEADVLGTDPLGAFERHLAPNPSQVTPSSTPTPTLTTCLYNNQTQVTVVEVKDLRQVVAIEIGYKDTNAWMEWIKCCLHIK
jgi:hypothetical protein